MVVVGGVGFEIHALVPLLNMHALSARHCLAENLKHGSGFSVIVVVVVVMVGTEHTASAASNVHPFAKHFFLRSPLHGLKSMHCLSLPSTDPKTHPSMALHFFRLRPSHTLPLPSALLHVLDGLSNTQPSVAWQFRPLRPLHI